MMEKPPIDNIKKQWEAIMSCIACGDCGFSIRPAVGRFLACPVKEAKGDEAFEPTFSRGKMSILKSVLEGSIPLGKELIDIAYQCTGCGGCTETCHQTRNPNIVLNTSKWIDHVKVWEAVRADLVACGLGPSDKHASLLAAMIDPAIRNPYGEPAARKRDWTAGVATTGASASMAFFGGCTFPLRQPATLQNLVLVLDRAGVALALPDEEWCCGSVAFRVGDPGAAREGIERTVASLERTGAGSVFTACAGCYRTMLKDWPVLLDRELPFEVLHVVHVLLRVIEDGHLFDGAGDHPPVTVAYHDPCHLGRHAGVYDTPRQVLERVPGVTLVELPRTGHAAWCCGSGGGVKSQYPDLAASISMNRIKEATSAGVDMIVSACPFCETGLSQAAREAGSGIEVVDIVDLVASRLG